MHACVYCCVLYTGFCTVYTHMCTHVYGKLVLMCVHVLMCQSVHKYANTQMHTHLHVHVQR